MPLIGYATRSGTRASDESAPRFANNETYARAIADNGGAPIMIPSLEQHDVIDAIYDVLDGVLLTGGPDVDTVHYGAERHPKTEESDAPMDAVELYLAGRALADGKPILGICRGIQLLNVCAGGTLFQDIADELGTEIIHPNDLDGRDALIHDVHIAEHSRLAGIVGRDSIPVNSLHHQAVRTIAPGFVPVATAPDGVVEALERPDHPFALAVQWHPEEMYRAEDAWANLFKSFVTAAAEYRERRQQ